MKKLLLLSTIIALGYAYLKRVNEELEDTFDIEF